MDWLPNRSLRPTEDTDVTDHPQLQLEIVRGSITWKYAAWLRN
jgi:hypothetical protein